MTENQPYQERVDEWCLAVPPRCPKYKMKFRTVNKTQLFVKERIVFECCGNNLLQMRRLLDFDCANCALFIMLIFDCCCCFFFSFFF